MVSMLGYYGFGNKSLSKIGEFMDLKLVFSTLVSLEVNQKYMPHDRVMILTMGGGGHIPALF